MNNTIDTRSDDATLWLRREGNYQQFSAESRMDGCVILWGTKVVVTIPNLSGRGDRGTLAAASESSDVLARMIVEDLNKRIGK